MAASGRQDADDLTGGDRHVADDLHAAGSVIELGRLESPQIAASGAEIRVLLADCRRIQVPEGGLEGSDGAANRANVARISLISLISLVKTLPRLASWAALRNLILAHLL